MHMGANKRSICLVKWLKLEFYTSNLLRKRTGGGSHRKNNWISLGKINCFLEQMGNNKICDNVFYVAANRLSIFVAMTHPQRADLLWWPHFPEVAVLVR